MNVIRQEKDNLESHGNRLHSLPPYTISYNHSVPEVEENHKTAAAMSDDSDVDAPGCIVAVGVCICLYSACCCLYLSSRVEEKTLNLSINYKMSRKPLQFNAMSDQLMPNTPEKKKYIYTRLDQTSSMTV